MSENPVLLQNSVETLKKCDSMWFIGPEGNMAGKESMLKQYHGLNEILRSSFKMVCPV